MMGLFSVTLVGCGIRRLTNRIRTASIAAETILVQRILEYSNFSVLNGSIEDSEMQILNWQ